MKTVEKKIYELHLDQEEKHWLLSVMQNPLWNKTPEEEDNYQKACREKLFYSLKDPHKV